MVIQTIPTYDYLIKARIVVNILLKKNTLMTVQYNKHNGHNYVVALAKL